MLVGVVILSNALDSSAAPTGLWRERETWQELQVANSGSARCKVLSMGEEKSALIANKDLAQGTKPNAGPSLKGPPGLGEAGCM